MQTTITNQPKETNVVPFKCEVEKPQIAQMLSCSERTVDNYMADGMPHRKPSSRKVTFDSDEVMKWYKDKYGVQRRKPNAPKIFSVN